MAISITFNKDEFASLAFEEFTGKWNPIALSELAEAEAEIIRTFLIYCGAMPAGEDENGAELWEGADPTNVLLVRAAEGGILDRIYGPSLFNKEGEVILKLAGCEFPVSVAGNEFKVGTLSGTLSFASEATKIKIKNDAGEEQEIEYFPATLDLMPDDGTEIEYKVNAQFDIQVKPPTVKAALKRGASIAEYLKPAPTGNGTGTEVIKMQELGEGEFNVSGYRLVETKENGSRYIVQLSDGTELWSRGMVETQLKDGPSRESIDKAIATGDPICLQITDIKKKGDKTYLNCVLRLRKAMTPEEQAKAKQAKRANAKPVSATA